MANEQFPRFNLVEHFKEECPEEYVFWRLCAVINHVTNEVLAYSVGRTVHVRESIFPENRVVSPWKGLAYCASEEYFLTFGRESPVSIENYRWLQLSKRAGS